MQIEVYIPLAYSGSTGRLVGISVYRHTDTGCIEVTFVWDDEIWPCEGITGTLVNGVYRAYRYLVYGLETVLIDGNMLDLNGCGGDADRGFTTLIQQHQSSLVLIDVDSILRLRLTSWNHLFVVDNQINTDPGYVRVPVSSPCQWSESRVALEARLSIHWPWKMTESTSATYSRRE